jgi:aromatic-L-amino-acid decarboxylase
LDNEEFRRHGHRFVDWMADYMSSVQDYPVRSQVAPGDVAGKLAAGPPTQSHAIDEIFEDFKSIVMPGMTHWQHPKFFAYFPANSSPPAVLAEMLTSTLAAQCMLWQTSPAATEMETRMMEWLGQMLGLGEGFEGVIQDSASSASLCAILTAREKATDWRANEEGLAAVPPLAVYVSDEAHTSIEKDVLVAGLGRKSLRKIPTDANYAMMPARLEAAIKADIAAGVTPMAVVACLGATSTGGIDPLRAVGEICRRYGIFFHVDAAWAGSALILDEHRWMIDGIEYVDSFVFNPHKWMFTNFDCSAHFIRDSGALRRTLTIMPEFLKSREGDAVIDYRDWSVPLGRRFRALKLWFVIRSYGIDGLKRKISDHIAWATELADVVENEPDFEIVAPRVLALFCFRYHPPGCDEEDALKSLNQKLVQAINDDGRLYLTQTDAKGRFAIRFVIGQTSTRRADVIESWDVIKELAANIQRLRS